MSTHGPFKGELFDLDKDSRGTGAVLTCVPFQLCMGCWSEHVGRVQARFLFVPKYFGFILFNLFGVPVECIIRSDDIVVWIRLDLFVPGVRRRHGLQAAGACGTVVYRWQQGEGCWCGCTDTRTVLTRGCACESPCTEFRVVLSFVSLLTVLI